jgi:hypothetical protein
MISRQNAVGSRQGEKQAVAGGIRGQGAQVRSCVICDRPVGQVWHPMAVGPICLNCCGVVIVRQHRREEARV